MGLWEEYLHINLCIARYRFNHDFLYSEVGKRLAERRQARAISNLVLNTLAQSTSRVTTNVISMDISDTDERNCDPPGCSIYDSEVTDQHKLWCITWWSQRMVAFTRHQNLWCFTWSSARGQGWLYVSTWTSMRLAPVRCRVLLHSLLPTHSASSSSSLSTTVIKFPYFRTPLANFLLSRPNSVEYGNSKTTTLLPLAKCARHSSKVELAAAGVHPVGMISSHASV